MGNNRSSISGNISSNQENVAKRKFWRKRIQSRDTGSHTWTVIQEEDPEREGESKKDRRASAGHHRDNANKIIGMLKKCKSEKTTTTIDNDSLSLEESIKSGNNDRPKYDGIPRAERPFCYSSSTMSRLNHRRLLHGNSNKRRVKSFRHFTRNPTTMNSTGTRFIGPLCSSMGLTEVQKQLILNRWNMISQHPNGFMAIWQPIYTEFVVNHPHLFPLAIYTNNDELENKVQAEESLSSNLAFKHHLKDFCQLLQYTFNGLDENQVGFIEQILLDFGANLHEIPSETYWEGLVECLCQAGKIERENPVETLQNNPLVDYYDYRPTNGCTFLCNHRSIEAWTIFCVYITSKIRFGYKMENFLRADFIRMVEGLNDIENNDD